MREKLQTTSIPDLVFEDIEGHLIKFSELYDYHKFLGSGAFGFVVAALDRETGESLALKVIPFLIFVDYRQKQLILSKSTNKGSRDFKKHSSSS
jgi:serine/threonine protein kinase